jgi:hypothetical protein
MSGETIKPDPDDVRRKDHQPADHDLSENAARIHRLAQRALLGWMFPLSVPPDEISMLEALMEASPEKAKDLYEALTNLTTVEGIENRDEALANLKEELAKRWEALREKEGG